MLNPIRRSRASTLVTSASTDPHAEKLCGLVDPFSRELAHVDETSRPSSISTNTPKSVTLVTVRAHAIRRDNVSASRSRVLGQLFDAERDALVLDVDRQDDRFDIVPFL